MKRTANRKKKVRIEESEPEDLKASSAAIEIPPSPPRSPSPPAPPPTPASPPATPEAPVVVGLYCPGCEADDPFPEGVDVLSEQVCDKCEAADVEAEVEQEAVAPPGCLRWVPDDSVVIRHRDLAIVAAVAALWGLLLPDLF